MIIMQASASEDEASDDSSSTVEDEDKEFSANEEDGKCDFHIALFALSSKCISQRNVSYLNKWFCKS